MAISHTRGNYWYKYNMPAPVVDLILADQHTVIAALTQGQIRKTSNDGAIWQYPVTTTLNEINMLSRAGNGDIFVGSQDGRMAYSTDVGDTFTAISMAIDDTGTGDVQVIADSNYAQNKIVYAATDIADKGVYRWIIRASEEWELIDLPLVQEGYGERLSGLAMGEEGTLYALRMEPATSPDSGGVNRSLNPAVPSYFHIEWDVINRTLPDGVTFDPTKNLLYDHTIPFLKFSGDLFQNRLWALDTHDANAHTIYCFIDNICKQGEWIDKAGLIGCDPVSGRNEGFNLIWEQLSLSDQYELNISKTETFDLRLPTAEPASNPYYLPHSITDPAYIVPADDTLECGHGYYWRVRTRHAITGEYIRSPWSEVGDFTIKAGLPVASPYYGLQLLSPQNDCGCSCNAPINFSWSTYNDTTAYWFELSPNPDMSNPIVSTGVIGTSAYSYNGKLECNQDYYWRVEAVEPSPSDWSAVFSFRTQPARAQLQSVSVDQVQIPAWVWLVIAASVLVIIFMFILIIKTRF